MTTLVIGSVAARHWFPDWREPKDVDVFCDGEPMLDSYWRYPRLRVEPFWHDSLNALLVHGDFRLATPDELYTIKFSHSYWELRNGSWNKHMFDLLELKRRGAQLIPEWHDVLYGIWEDRHGKKQVSFDAGSGGDDEEVWLPYPTDPRYRVSNLGKVIGQSGRVIDGTEVDCNGITYRRYDVAGKKVYGHHMVMETFVGPRPEGMQVRHLDSNPLNNRVSNLMYGTPTDNAQDRVRHGTHARGGDHPNAKLTDQTVREIRALYAAGGITQQQLADEYCVSTTLIHRVISHQAWSGQRGFFEDAVTRVFDHDSLHRSVAYTPGKPIYEEVLADGASVKMDMQKVWALPHERIVQMFREEIYVTALERLVIPSNYTHSPGAAYQWALRRTITSLTKGRSARFLVEHFDEFRRPDMNYVQHHLAHKDFLIKLEAA